MIRFLRRIGLLPQPATAVSPAVEAPVESTEDAPKVHIIPSGYPAVKDPEMPQFEFLNSVQAYFRDHYRHYRNCVVQSGTGTGKTVLAYIASRYFLDAIERVILVVPTRELARNQEKMAWAIWGSGVVARNAGKDDKKLETRNFVITTPEGFISAVRQKKDWTRAGLLIVDEAHNLLGDRGSVLDAVITLHLNAGGRLLLMSGTLPNKEALAEHYKADLFVSDYVKTKLNDDPYVQCPDDFEAIEAPKELSLGMVTTMTGYAYRQDSLRLYELRKKLSEFEGKSILVFVPTKAIGYCLSESLVAPFHCADLEEVDRNRIVDEFNSGVSKVVIATNTLSEGVNTSADVVIVFGSRSGGGKNYFDLNQVKQMFGRAGREKADAFAFILGDRIEIAHAKKYYVVNSLPLPLESMVLTLLSLQPSGKKALCDAVGSSFAASMSSPEKVKHAVEGYLSFLSAYTILKEDVKEGRYSLTVEGHLLARYFIPPKDYFTYMKIARRLMKVSATPQEAAAFHSGAHEGGSPPAAPAAESACCVDPATAAVCLTAEEKGCILIATILNTMMARNCPPRLLKEMKFKLIPLELEEAVNVARAALLMHYMDRPSAISPYFKFQINDVARWTGMFKDMIKFGVHRETPGKAEIETALKPLKIAIAKNDEINRKKAAAKKKAPAPKTPVLTLFPATTPAKDIAA